MSVKNTHPDYDRMAPKWKRCRDVMAGQDAMRAATIASSVKRMETQTTVEAYIPALKDQTPATTRATSAGRRSTMRAGGR
jgi:hypothetical protein